jgi:hypothetical protein
MKREITFSFPAEAMQGASEIYLVGDFNNWNVEDAIRFQYELDGFFRAIAELEEGQTYHYRFLLNNGSWVNDYQAEAYVQIPELYIDNCVITVPVSVIEEKKDNEKPKTQEKTSSVSNKADSTKTKKSTKTTNDEVSAKSASAKSSTTKKPASKITKTNADDKKPTAPKSEKPAKTAKKSPAKGKK